MRERTVLGGGEPLTELAEVLVVHGFGECREDLRPGRSDQDRSAETLTALCHLWEHGRVFDAQRVLHDLQDAVLRRDRQRLDDMVSDRMIWVIPVLENARGKHDWIEASCGVVWHWFRVTVRREVDLGDVRIVESHISQSREPSGHEGATGPVTAEGIVVDAWVHEGETWRLVARHPQRLG